MTGPESSTTPTVPGSSESAAAKRPASWLGSAVLHAGVLLVMAAIHFPGEPLGSARSFTGTLANATDVDGEMTTLELRTVEPPAQSGGTTEAVPMAEPTPLVVADVAVRVATPDVVKTPAVGSGGGRNDGRGRGDSEDPGKGLPAFFDAGGGGTRIVYVVDCSRSMRKPFRGQERTRFARVKRELITAIRGLSDGQRFYVIFFNDLTYPMPGGQYIPAKSLDARRACRWVASAQPSGNTDPREALLMALTLRPDTLFFLTDGEFHQTTVDEVVAANRFGTRVNAIGFGGDLLADDETEPSFAEQMLTELASRTGGEVSFIASGRETHSR